MLTKKIYRGNRGEGKTKWLVDRAIDTVIKCDQGIIDQDEVKLFYNGDYVTYVVFSETYREVMHTRCPIEHWEHRDMNGCHNAILFTDELMYNINCVPSNLPIEGTWFITMDAEDFV